MSTTRGLATLVIAIATGVTVGACGEPPSASTAQFPITTKRVGATAKPPEQTAKALDGSFTVLLPDKWKAVQTNGQRILMQLITSRSPWPKIEVMTTSPGELLPSIQASADRDINAQKQFFANLVVDPPGAQPTTVAGEPGLRYASRAGIGRGIVVFVRHKGVEYGIRYTSREEAVGTSMPDYDAIMKSWKWTK